MDLFNEMHLPVDLSFTLCWTGHSLIWKAMSRSNLNGEKNVN